MVVRLPTSASLTPPTLKTSEQQFLLVLSHSTVGHRLRHGMAGSGGDDWSLLLDVCGLRWDDPDGRELEPAGHHSICIWSRHMAGLGFLTTWPPQHGQNFLQGSSRLQDSKVVAARAFQARACNWHTSHGLPSLIKAVTGQPREGEHTHRSIGRGSKASRLKFIGHRGRTGFLWLL